MIFPSNLFWEKNFPSFSLLGEGSRKFLNGQTTTDFLGSDSGHIIRTCWLSLTGKMNALLEVKLHEEGADLIVIEGNINDVLEGFERVIFPADKIKVSYRNDIKRVQILTMNLSWKNSSVQWFELDQKLPNEFNALIKTSLQDLEVWKIKQGLPTYSREINGENNPFELGLSDIVNLNKGCYLGQEAMARIFRSNSLKHQLRYWEVDSVDSSGIKANQLVNSLVFDSGHKVVGEITTVVKINDSCFLGLALIRSKYLFNKELFISEKMLRIRIEIPIGFTSIFNEE